MIVPDLPNVSAIAFYGEKPPQLKTLIETLQAYLSNCESVQSRFIPYQLAQVHGTIIGCEGLATDAGIVNKWFWELRNEIRYIDLTGLVDYLQHQVSPITIRLGGYQRDRDYQFLSRQQSLYFRSFQLQPAADGIIPVLIGWSGNENRITWDIDNLRRSLQQFNILHKYHGNPQAVDNDFYLRLGTISGEISPQTQQAIATEVRDFLETQPPLYLPLQSKNLAVVQYQDLAVDPSTTKIMSIVDLTAERLRQMY